LFGAAWGKGMGGVKGIFDSKDDEPSPKTPPTPPSDMKQDQQLDEEEQHSFENDVKFPETLERLVLFIRKELVRLHHISDKTIVTGQTSNDQPGLTQFNKI
jgi:hypothetical protein